MAGSFGDFALAAQMRDVIQRIVADELEKQRPRYRYATVIEVDVTTRRVTVQYPGDPGTQIVRMGGFVPEAGQTVRIDGLPGDRAIVDVIGHPLYADPADVQVFTTTGSHEWVLPTGIRVVTFIAIGGGGGAGSGRIFSTGNGRSGGGGGEGGARTEFTIEASLLPAGTYLVEVGAGGDGGASREGLTNTGGQDGTGGAPSFVSNPAETENIVFAAGGNPGMGGTASTGTPGSGGPVGREQGAAGGAGSGTGTGGDGFSTGLHSTLAGYMHGGAAAGGGGGGGVTSGNTAQSGGTGGNVYSRFLLGGAGSTVVGTPGGAGGGSIVGLSGSGGGGGRGGNSTNGLKTGGDGGLYGGGGGGGAGTTNGLTGSNKGGDGADGCVVIIATY